MTVTPESDTYRVDSPVPPSLQSLRSDQRCTRASSTTHSSRQETWQQITGLYSRNSVTLDLQQHKRVLLNQSIARL